MKCIARLLFAPWHCALQLLRHSTSRAWQWAKIHGARAGVPFSRPAPSSKGTPAQPLQERFADSVIAHKACHVVVTTTAKDDVVQDILIYWSGGDTRDMLKALERRFGKPAAHFVKPLFLNGRRLADAVSSWPDGTNVTIEFHSMDGESPYISMSTKKFIEGQ